MMPAAIGKCPERKVRSHTPLHSASFAGHEIQRRHTVGASRTREALVESDNEGATVRAPLPRQQLRQQRAQRQRQQQAVKPLRNDSEQLNDGISMQTYRHLFEKVCEYDNLHLAFIKARKRKSKKGYVQNFEKNLPSELLQLQRELLTGIYRPAPITTFTVRDPKTRKISASHFRDRVVHHAICNIIEPIFESRFIYDTFANRKGKGTSGIITRFDTFKRKVGPDGFVLKADIRHYFETVDQQVLIEILGRRIKDERMMSVIRIILENHKTASLGKGMPLGNLTSQFFANIYLGELDYFVKHELHAKHYVRYVDDFIILGKDAAQLEGWKGEIDAFLSSELKIALHPDKTKIIRIKDGVPLVGFRVFPKHKLLKKSNLRRLKIRFGRMEKGLKDNSISREHAKLSLAGTNGYIGQANTFNLRQELSREFPEIGGMMA